MRHQELSSIEGGTQAAVAGAAAAAAATKVR